MENYSNNVFKYNNKKYSFFVNLYTGNGKDDDLRVSLDAADIEEFVYENKLNDLVMKGHVIYTDKYAQVDKFINQHFGYCSVLFCENKQKNDDGVVIEKMDDEQKFIHTFVITDIKVISRSASIVKYEIDFVSNNWFKCIANVDFTNYNRDPEQIFDILKACLKNNDLMIDDKTFDKVKSAVKTHYITNTNDNLFSIVKYLMHKMYYFEDKDQSVKFFLYNETTDKYQLLDIADKSTSTGMYTTILSFFKTNNESLIQQEPTNIGMIRSSTSKTDVYRNFFKYNMYDYSYDTNLFQNREIQPKTTLSYANEKMDVENYQEKFYKMYDTSLVYRNEGTYWNNDNSLYQNTVKALGENNAFVLNITGEILRKPGSLLEITLDRSMKNVTSENKKELEKIKKKYKAYEGIWFVSKVQHIICPHDQSYRQQVVLFRNFIPKLQLTN